MLRVADKSFDSNVGRQRQGNEDNFFVRPPLFVVADGMGGAQAGEVASQMAVEAFRSGLADEYEPEASLAEVIEDANSRIHELSRSDSQRQGMGTTCTAAFVSEEDVVLAHVGDSRCYLFRDGELTRLTTDHSLVGELVARGKLTEDEAELHPQRSVITRALGPESQVRVDTQRIAARNGDVFLLCSDGLTAMIREHQILPIMRDAPSLDEAVRQLIAAANEAGGRDNITVILFRIEEVEVKAGAAADAGDGYDDFGTGAIRTDEQPTQATEPVLPPDEVEDDYRKSGTVALAAIRPGQMGPPPAQPPAGAPPSAAPDAPEPSEEPTQPVQPAADAPTPAAAPAAAAAAQTPAPAKPVPTPPPLPPSAPRPTDAGATRPKDKKPAKPPRPPKPKGKRRIPVGLILALVLIVIILGGAYIATRAVFFIGADTSSRAVTIYRGLPYDLPMGVEMYSRHYTSGKTLDQVPASRRSVFTDHKLRTLTDAEDLVQQLEEGRLNQ